MHRAAACVRNAFTHWSAGRAVHAATGKVGAQSDMASQSDTQNGQVRHMASQSDTPLV